MSPREKFHSEIAMLKEQVYTMGDDLSEKFTMLYQVLENNDLNLAKGLIESDKKTNKLEIEINNQAISLITQQSPLAIDLRMIISCIKIAEDLERIGDNISNIAEITKYTRFKNQKAFVKITTMIMLAKLMLDDALYAMKNDDLNLVNEIIERDEDINNIFLQVTITDTLNTDMFLHGELQLTAKYLERCGDHIKNMCEHIYFTLTGKHYA